MKSGIHQSTLTPCDMSSAATSPSPPFSGTSLPSMLDLASQCAEGNGNKVFFLANNNSVNKSETPEPLSDKPACPSFPAAEVAKTQDCPGPQPVPEGKNGSLPEGTLEVCCTIDIHCPDSSGTTCYDGCESVLQLPYVAKK